SIGAPTSDSLQVCVQVPLPDPCHGLGLMLSWSECHAYGAALCTDGKLGNDQWVGKARSLHEVPSRFFRETMTWLRRTECDCRLGPRAVCDVQQADLGSRHFRYVGRRGLLVPPQTRN